MARIARVILPGHPHHVTQRGVRSMRIFRGDEGRRQYLEFLREEARRNGVEILAYCLMPNHAHFIAVPKRRGSLARTIGDAHRRYTRMVNFREGVRGHLFQERFHSCPLDREHCIGAALYVERNPVRARLARRAVDYPWSSARFHAGLAKKDPLVKRRTLMGEALDWRALLGSAPAEEGRLRLCTRTGRPCGGEAFIAEAESVSGRQLRSKAPGRHFKQASVGDGRRQL